MPGNIRLFLVLLLIALGTVFVVQNTTVVEIRFLFWTLSMSRALLVVFLLLLGITIGWLLRGHFAASNQRADKTHSEPPDDTNA